MSTIDPHTITMQATDGSAVEVTILSVETAHTREELSAAFDLVKSKEHWKYPILAYVELDADQALIAEAVAYFTGSEAHFRTAQTEAGEKLLVTADGYFVAIGA